MKFFTSHPTFIELGDAIGSSHFTVRRLVKCGVLRTVRYPREDRVHRDDSNRLVTEGLSESERLRYKDYNRQRNERGERRTENKSGELT